MSEPITIVIVRALGLSGATWFNLVLGSHDEAMSMGPVARILDLPIEQADHACFVHRDHCGLWPAFLRERDHRGRFFADLAAFTGKRVFIVNYPPRALIEREIEGKGHRVLTVRLQRDGRAALFSHMRHYGTMEPGSAINHIVGWQMRVWDRVDRKMPADPQAALVVRHEDMVLQPTQELQRIGKFIGIRYGEDATQFWKRPQHMTAGNTGVIDLVCRLQGEGSQPHDRAEAYAQLAGRLEAGTDRAYLDRSWIEGLSRQDRLAFDCLLGARNALYGYERDDFPSAERDAFWRDLDGLIAGARATGNGPATGQGETAAGQTADNWFSRLLSKSARKTA